MVVYADTVWTVNALIDSLMLLLAAKLCGYCTNPVRCFLGGAIGGVYAVFSMLPSFVFLNLWLWKLVFYFIMAVTAYGFRKGAIRPAVISFLCSFSLAGFFLLLLEYFPLDAIAGRGGVLYPVGTKIMLILAGGFYLAAALLTSGSMRHGEREMYDITLRTTEHRLQLKALLDTGNSLREPISGKPVLVLAPAAAKQLFGLQLDRNMLSNATGIYGKVVKDYPEYRFRLIPYRAVGISTGMLLAVSCRMTLGNRERQIFAALSPHAISDGGAYDALIGRNVL